MRHHRAFAIKSATLALGALLFAGAGQSARAQAIPFDLTDWVQDRGVKELWTTTPPGAVVSNGQPRRLGAPQLVTPPNGNNRAFNNAGGAKPRWVWPRRSDISLSNSAFIVDNYNPTVTYATKTNESNGLQPSDGQAGFTQNATNPFNIIAPANFGPDNGGYSFIDNASASGVTINDYHDYAAAFAVHDDFVVQPPKNGLTLPPRRSATADELNALPNTPPYVYAVVDNVLRANLPRAQWAMGAHITIRATTSGASDTVTNIPAGRYGVDIYSPGSGTKVNGTAHPNVTRAFVKVSWKNTVFVNGGIGTGINANGVNDPVNSRIYPVDLSQQGWIHVQGGNLQPASFPYAGANADGTANADQIVVTLYVVTPDSLSDATKYVTTPVVTADAVRFVPQSNVGNAVNLGSLVAPNNTIMPQGRIMSPIVGSENTALTPAGAKSAASPRFFVAREEQRPDTTTLRSYVNPRDTSKTSPDAPDPTAVTSIPVFYALDNSPEINGDAGTTDVFNSAITGATNDSIGRVLWRYEGVPDVGSGTQAASPLLANVRCRDGVVRPMIYFVTTSANGNLGHVYALDPNGNGDAATTRTTKAYWIYPSYRPLRSADYKADGTPAIPVQFYDPNYTLPGQNGIGKPGNRPIPLYPASKFVVNNLPINDQPVQGPLNVGPVKPYYYDGDIIADPSSPGNYILNPSTQIDFKGVVGAPTLVDDPDGKTLNANAPQLLLVPNSNGRIFAFDAGGRGDYGTVKLGGAGAPPLPAAGTTQRIWTWPHFGADAYHAQINRATAGTPDYSAVNRFADEAGRGGFLTTPAYDDSSRTYVPDVATGPIVVGDSQGRVYALRNKHDVLNGLTGSLTASYQERRVWTYPAANREPLGEPISTVALFRPTGSNFANYNQVYFTCGGRVYCLNNPTSANGNIPYRPGLRWVYPPSTNPPFQDPNNPGPTSPLSPGFNSAAPVLLDTASIQQDTAYTGAQSNTTVDRCYALTQDGFLYSLNANTGRVIATGDTVYGTFTNCTPIAVRVDANASIYVPVTGTNPPAGSVSSQAGINTPAIVFADDFGNIYGLRAAEERAADYYTDPTTGGAAINYLPVIWGYGDSGAQRVAAAAFSNNTIVEGDENGQLRAYYNQTGGTIPPNETGPRINGVTSPVTIDLRVVDIYEESDWNQLGKTETIAERDNDPNAKDANGNVIGKVIPHATARLSNIGTRLGADWGEYVYVAASGVYHAMPTRIDPNHPEYTYGTAAPVLNIRVQSLQPNGQYHDIRDVDVPLFTNAAAGYPRPLIADDNGTGANAWPDDLGITPAEHSLLSIQGQDLNANPDGTVTLLTGPANNVFPWVAKAKVLIDPTTEHPYLPGGAGTRIRVLAEIRQTLVEGQNGLPYVATNQSNYLTAGLRDNQGKSNSQVNQEPGALFNGPPQTRLSGRGRSLYIANPLAATTSGDGGQAITGANNIIGWAGSVTKYPYAELLGNNNRVGAGGVGPQSGFKSLFAPIPMANDGLKATYEAVTSNNAMGPKVNALAVADRSNLALLSADTGANSQLRIRAVVQPQVWHGDYTSVMNPLPWDLLPTDADGTTDYPPISADQIHVIGNGTDATIADVALTPPTVAPNGTQADRQIVATPLTLSVDVPRFQPPNLNRGLVASGSTLFGSPYTLKDGTILGDSNGGTTTTPAIGPMRTDASRSPVTLGNGNLLQPGAFPAAGYTSKMLLVVQLPGNSTGRAVPFQPYGLNPSFANADGAKLPNREVWFGMAVAPRFAIDTSNTPGTEQLVDLGAAPAGSGYSDPVSQAIRNPYGGNSYFRVPFAPSSMGLYQDGAATATAKNTSPWDDPNNVTGSALGSFFQPFAVYNNGNVNLVDVKVAKLLGKTLSVTSGDSLSAFPNTGNGDSGGTAKAGRLDSDAVNNLMTAPLPLVAFGGPSVNNPGVASVGNIGLVTSFDHLASANSTAKTSERSLYPIYNPALTLNAADLSTQANKLIQGTTNEAGQKVGIGLLRPGNTNTSWFNANVPAQPYPTIHKPRTGDTNGVTASVPDAPYDFANLPATLFTNGIRPTLSSPKMGMALPPGTPVGTYTGQVYVYEDSVPVQWREFQAQTSPIGNNGQAIPFSVKENDQDGVLNINRANNPVETFAPDYIKVKIGVTETRLTENTSKNGVLSQIDPLSGTGYQGASFLPAVAAIPGPVSNGTLSNSRMMIYWTTNRQINPLNNNNSGATSNGSPYLQTNTTVPLENAPYGLAYSSLLTPYGVYPGLNGNPVFTSDFLFAAPGTNAAPASGRLFGVPDANGNNEPYQLYPGYYTGGPRRYQPFGYDTLFPSSAGAQPYVPGTINPTTVKYAAPGVAMAITVDPTTGSIDPTDTEGYLFWQGQADKARTVTANLNTATQAFDSRTFYVPLVGSVGTTLGTPQPIASAQSLLNDPTLPKIGPKPLLLKFTKANANGPAHKLLYQFWHSGTQGRTSLYYNVNVQSDLAAPFGQSGWLTDPTAGGNGYGDQRLPTPGSLVWQSDPYPVYRRVRILNTATGSVIPRDAIDVAYTGVLKGRQKTEILLSRFAIHRKDEAGFADSTKNYKTGQLELMPLPDVHQEAMHRVGSTFEARDAGWYLGPDTDPTGAGGTVKLEMLRADGTRLTLNARSDGKAQLGRYDNASGLTYYDVIARNPADNTVVKAAGVASGGQAVVDTRSGTVTFPNIPPASTDRVLVSYTPRVMRLNAGRGDSNVDRDTLPAAFLGDPIFGSRSDVTSTGSNTNAVLLFDRAPNLRVNYTSPQVVFNANGSAAAPTAPPPITRMWVFYRKTDLNAGDKQPRGGISVKAMRLVARLPRPIKLQTAGGKATFNVRITGALGQYEVDWVRNRIYFTEADEGSRITVNYTYADLTGAAQASGPLQYVVAWGDEPSNGAPSNTSGYSFDPTLAEQNLPMTAINEGQVTAVKDPVLDKVWLFWTSTRHGTSDLFYETYAPQLYPLSSIQQ